MIANITLSKTTNKKIKTYNQKLKSQTLHPRSQLLTQKQCTHTSLTLDKINIITNLHNNTKQIRSNSTNKSNTKNLNKNLVWINLINCPVTHQIIGIKYNITINHNRKCNQEVIMNFTKTKNKYSLIHTFKQLKILKWGHQYPCKFSSESHNHL